MKILTERWDNFLSDKKLLMSFLVSFLFLIISFWINFIAGNYATEKASLPVTDVVLSNIRPFDVDGAFVYGPLIFWTFAFFFLMYNPRKIPFVAKSIALFVIIRSIFITLTHIGPFPTQIFIDSQNIFNKFTFGGDLFFSGHTGLPFLLSLIFWHDKFLRYTFLVSSIFFGTVVLLGHLHYSIDVLSAFFITYTIFHIALYFFKYDWEIFQKERKNSIR